MSLWSWIWSRTGRASSSIHSAKFAEVQLLPDRREEEGFQRPSGQPHIQSPLPDDVPGPIIVLPVLQDELHLVPVSEVVQVRPEVLVSPPRTRDTSGP